MRWLALEEVGLDKTHTHIYIIFYYTIDFILGICGMHAYFLCWSLSCI
jgi:hypothetical protein